MNTKRLGKPALYISKVSFFHISVDYVFQMRSFSISHPFPHSQTLSSHAIGIPKHATDNWDVGGTYLFKTYGSDVSWTSQGSYLAYINDLRSAGLENCVGQHHYNQIRSKYIQILKKPLSNRYNNVQFNQISIKEDLESFVSLHCSNFFDIVGKTIK